GGWGGGATGGCGCVLLGGCAFFGCSWTDGAGGGGGGGSGVVSTGSGSGAGSGSGSGVDSPISFMLDAVLLSVRGSLDASNRIAQMPMQRATTQNTAKKPAARLRHGVLFCRARSDSAADKIAAWAVFDIVGEVCTSDPERL